MAPEPLLVIDEPALAVHRHNRNVGTGDQAVILKHLGAGHGVFVDPLAAARLVSIFQPRAFSSAISAESISSSHQRSSSVRLSEHEQLFIALLDLVIFRFHTISGANQS
jgi:hypothetical protein